MESSLDLFMQMVVFDAKFRKKILNNFFNWATVLERILLKTCHIRKP